MKSYMSEVAMLAPTYEVMML